jgi:hypothetical protein
MATFRQLLLGSTAAVAIACVPLASAVAGPYGYGHPFGWSVGRGLFGAAVALATLPIAIASAVVSSGATVAQYPSPGYGGGGYGGGYGYAPQVAYPAPVYYAPRPVFYPGGAYPGRGYPVARPYYAPHPAYPGRGYYHAGGYAYPHR